jgi:hypothetical protein
LRKGLNYRSEFHKWPIYRACGLCGHFSFAPRALPAGHYYHSIVRKGLGEGGSRESHTGGTRSRFRKAVELGGSEAVDVSWSLSRPNFVQLETSVQQVAALRLTSTPVQFTWLLPNAGTRILHCRMGLRQYCENWPQL